MIYLVDSWAWIEYLDGSPIGEKISKIIESEQEIYTLLLNLSEVISRVKRSGKDYNLAYNHILSNSKIIDLNPEIAKEAGLIHAEIKKKISNFGLMDALILASARKIGAKIITGDEHFKGMKEAIFLK